MDTLLVILLVLYFLPTICARSSRRASVFVVNLFAGWTLFGWVLALFLAARSHE